MKEMAQIDVTNSMSALFTGDIALDNLSGWVIWELVLAVAFVILSTLTVYFFLAKSGLFKKKRKRKSVPRKGREKPETKRIVRKKSKKIKPVLKKGKKKVIGKAKQKSGISNLRKMPFILDPNAIRSYTSKYLAVKKIKANWEKILLVGVDSASNRLELAVFLLTKEFMWRLGAGDVIEYHQRAVKPTKFFKNKGINKTFEKAAALISVGIVTEIADEEQKEGLAQARAEKMVVWLKKSLPRKSVDYLLIIESPLIESGEAVESVIQPEKPRPILWICLQPSSGDVDVEEALKDALSRAIQLPFDFDSYQKVSLINIHN
jgi:hypothetical protein